MLKDLVDMLNPKGGRGLNETIIAVIVIIGLFVLNYKGIEPSQLIEWVAILFFGYMWGNRPQKKEGGKNE